jgi:SAM-dependent methyltransferase
MVTAARIVKPQGVMLVLCFAAALFVSSAQLFLIQPMVAKSVLPLLGGTPAVWNTCMVFFQCALLAGYLYAHLGARWLGARRQAILHVALLLVSVAALPGLLAPAAAPAATGSPTWWLLRLLVVTVGVPFFVVSTTAPMLQRWFATTGHRSAGDPYFLYAASNAGSLVALVGYPLVVEPTLRLGEQARLWIGGYGVLGVLTAACAAIVCWSPVAQPLDLAARSVGAAAAEPMARDRARWIALAFAPSSLLLGVTTFITTDIAAVPLLWVAPLAIYLLTFVLVFSSRTIVSHELVVRLLPIVVLPVTLLIGLSTQLPPAVHLVVHLTTFFVAAMACHGELARSRPSAGHLTEFYLCMSIGGALGGLFNALVAPVVFTGVLEYPLALAAACLLGMPDRSGWTIRRIWRDLAVAAAIGVVMSGLLFATHRGALPAALGVALVFLVPALACFRFRRQPVRFAFGVAVLVVASGTYMDAHHRVVLRDRSFFGVHRITRDPAGERHLFVPGGTLHGVQHVDRVRRREPLTYFHRASPIGQVLSSDRATRLRNVGVVGLGIGVLAAYGEPGQDWVFYEIDPAVERIARDGRYFTYLADSRAAVSVVLGDARLSLMEAPHGRFDLLVLDAFSSDAIPAHLVTREAFQLYYDKLAPGGLIAFHISNRYLDLEPVLGSLAAAAGTASLAQLDVAPTPADQAAYKRPSHWVLMARHQADLAPFASDARWRPARQSGAAVWTDDFSNVLSVIRWRD